MLVTPVELVAYLGELCRLLHIRLTLAKNGKEELPTSHERERIAARDASMQGFSESLQKLVSLSPEKLPAAFAYAMSRAAMHYAHLRRDMQRQGNTEVTTDAYARVAGEAGGIEQGLICLGQSQLVICVCRELGAGWVDFDPYEPVDHEP